MMVSDCPPSPPSTQYEYISAVSMKLYPASTKASRISNDFSSSNVQPKTFPPKLNGATSKLVFPNFIFFIYSNFNFSFLIPIMGGRNGIFPASGKNQSQTSKEEQSDSLM